MFLLSFWILEWECVKGYVTHVHKLQIPDLLNYLFLYYLFIFQTFYENVLREETIFSNVSSLTYIFSEVDKILLGNHITNYCLELRTSEMIPAKEDYCHLMS